jgi:hypothetical protein
VTVARRLRTTLAATALALVAAALPATTVLDEPRDLSSPAAAGPTGLDWGWE